MSSESTVKYFTVLDLPEVDLMNFRVEWLSDQSDLRGFKLRRASDEVARGGLVSLEGFLSAFRTKMRNGVTRKWCLSLPLRVLDLN